MRGYTKQLHASAQTICTSFLWITAPDGFSCGFCSLDATEFSAMWWREGEREMVHQCDTSVTLGDAIIKRVGNHESWIPCLRMRKPVSALVHVGNCSECIHHHRRVLFATAGGKHEQGGIVGKLHNTVKWAKIHILRLFVFWQRKKERSWFQYKWKWKHVFRSSLIVTFQDVKKIPWSLVL